MMLSISEIKGRKRFHKSVYILEEAGVPFEEKFEWDNFGPYSKELASEIDTLCQMGLIEECSYLSQGTKEYSYKLTEKGLQIAKRMIESNKALFGLLKEKMEKLNQYDTTELVKLASIRFLTKRGYDIGYMNVFLEYTKGYQKSEVLKGKQSMEELFISLA